MLGKQRHRVNPYISHRKTPLNCFELSAILVRNMMNGDHSETNTNTVSDLERNILSVAKEPKPWFNTHWHYR